MHSGGQGECAHGSVGLRLGVPEAAVGGGLSLGLGHGAAAGAQAVQDGLAAGGRLRKGVGLSAGLRQGRGLCTQHNKGSGTAEQCWPFQGWQAQLLHLHAGRAMLLLYKDCRGMVQQGMSCV